MEINDRVMVLSYRSWKPDGEPFMVSDEKHLTGYIGALKPISTGPDGVPMPNTDWHVWVVLDNPIGAQDVIQCKESRLIKLEE